MQPPSRILVVRTDRLGDVVVATPLLRALRRTFPDAYLAALVRPYTRDLLRHDPHLDEVLVDDPLGADRGPAGFARGVMALRRRRFDTALLLLPRSRVAWMLALAGIRRRIGVGRKFYQVATRMELVSRDGYVPLRHEADYCLDLGRRLGVRSADLATELVVTDSERAAARSALEEAGALAGEVLVGVHASHGGSSPNWPIERWAEFVRELALHLPNRGRIVLSGESSSPGFPASPRIIDARGPRPLREVMALLSQLDVLVSSSTGPMHIAAALAVPTVSLFCPLPACSPELWGPRGNVAVIVLPPAGYCQGRCPGDPKRCTFEETTVGRVVEAVQDVLAERARTT